MSGVVMSLTATISSSGERSLAARNTLRPMRPKPLIPTSHSHAGQPPAIRFTPCVQRCAPPYHRPRPPRRPGDAGARPSPGGCSRPAPRAAPGRRRGARARSSAASRTRGRQRLPARRVRLEHSDQLDLTNPGRRRPAQVGRLGVEPAVDPAADLADHPPGLEGETPGLRADRAQRRADRGAGPDRDHPPAAALPDLRVDAERCEVSRPAARRPSSPAQPISRYGSPSGRTRRPAPRNAPRSRLRVQHDARRSRVHASSARRRRARTACAARRRPGRRAR